MKEILGRTLRKADPKAVVNALKGFNGRVFSFGKETFLLDKKGLKHILERHHPRYWDGSVKQQQSFLDASMSVGDVTDVVEQVLKQNREKLVRQGSNGRYQMRGTVDGVDYVLGVNRGRVGQLYSK